MTKIQSSRAIGIALMVVMTLAALALPVASQELTPVLTVVYSDGSTTSTPGTAIGPTWQFNVVHVGGAVVSASVTMPDGDVFLWEGQGSSLVDPCGPAGGTASWHWVLTASQSLVISDASCQPLAVVLTDFAAVCHQGSQILVTWETTSEVGNTGFNMLKSADGGQVVYSWFIPSQSPGGTAGANYTYFDFDITPGQTYWYWLESVDTSGVAVRYGPVIATCDPPTAVEVSNFSATTSPRAPMPWCLSAAVLSAGGMFIALRHGRRRRNF